MPTIRTPDGRRLRVPDGATPEQISQVLQSQGYDMGGQVPRGPIEHAGAEARDPTADMPTLDRLRAGFGKAFADTGRGLQQFGTERLRDIASGDVFNLMPEGMGVRNAATDYLDRSLADQRNEIDDARQRDEALMQTGAGLAGNIGGQVAQMAALPAGAGLGARLGGAAVQGGLYAGTQPVAGDESRMGNVGAGAALGALGQGVASGLGRLAQGARDRVPQAVQESIELARRAGIPLNVAQTSGSMPIRAAQAASRWLPLSGAGRAAQNQQEAFNRAVARAMGADAPALTDDVMRQARGRIGQVFEDVYSRNDVPLTAAAMRKFAAIESDATKRLTEAEAQVVRNQLDAIIDNADNGVLTGQKYQAVRTMLQRAEGNDKLGSAVKELRKALDEHAAATVGPQDAAALAKSRGQWANLRTVEEALKQVGGAAGNVRPASLWPLIRNGSTKEMRELAKIGQNVLKDGLGDSGTAQRQFYTNLLTGGTGLSTAAAAGALPLFLQGAAGGALLGRALNSNTASRLLQQGNPTSLLAGGAQRALPRGLPLAAPQVNSLLGGLDISGGRVATPEELAADEEIVRRFRAGQR